MILARRGRSSPARSTSDEIGSMMAPSLRLSAKISDDGPIRERDRRKSCLSRRPGARSLLARETAEFAAAAQVRQDDLRGVMTRRTGDAAAWMGAGAAMIEPGNGTAVVSVSEHRARREQLIERHRAVENIAAEEAELAFEIERAQHLATDDARGKAGRVALDRRDHQVGDGVAA